MFVFCARLCSKPLVVCSVMMRATCSQHWRTVLTQHAYACRNFYHEHPAVTARTQAEVDEYRRKREIHVVGTGVPRPVTNFEEASFPGKAPCAAKAHAFSLLPWLRGAFTRQVLMCT